MPKFPSAPARHQPSDGCLSIEVRPGEGGDDAAAFADELVASLTAWARRQHWNVREAPGEARTTVVTVTGADAQALRAFAGCHRVQRVPKGTTKRHTSTALVAVLDESETPDLLVHDDDLIVTTARGSGPGGQHRNKTESAVRIRHLPSGLTVTCQESRSQQTNLLGARAELERRLRNEAAGTAAQRRNEDRVAQIKDADRSVKSFTHNAQRDEVIDHQTGRRWRLRDFRKGQLS